MDLTFVWSTNVGAVLMKIILQLLPLKNDCRHRGHHSCGNIGPDDIDWAQLTRNGGKLLNDQWKIFYKLLISGLKDRLGNALVLYLHLGKNFGQIGQGLGHLRQHVEVI